MRISKVKLNFQSSYGAENEALGAEAPTVQWRSRENPRDRSERGASGEL